MFVSDVLVKPQPENSEASSACEHQSNGCSCAYVVAAHTCVPNAVCLSQLFSSIWWVCMCMCVWCWGCVYTSLWKGVHWYICLHMHRGQISILDVFLSHYPLFSRTWSSLNEIPWVTRELQRDSCVSLPSPGVIAACRQVWIFTWVLGIQFRSACLHGKS